MSEPPTNAGLGANAASGDAAYNATRPADVGRVPTRGGVVGDVPSHGGGMGGDIVPNTGADFEADAGLGNPAYNELPPRRLRRLHRVWPDRDGNISYLLTLCVDGRAHVLNKEEIFKRLTAFLLDSPSRYQWFPRRFVVMPDHLHLITHQGHAAVRLGQWIKALKAVVGGLKRRENAAATERPVESPNAASGDAAYNATRPAAVGRVPSHGGVVGDVPSPTGHEFTRLNRSWHWQEGFHDHKFRTPESEQRKWDYVCLNPVRAGLVERPEQWPFGGEIFYGEPAGPSLVRGTPPLLEAGILIKEGETPVGRVPSRGASAETPGGGTRSTTAVYFRKLNGLSIIL